MAGAGTSLVGLKSYRHFFLADYHENCCIQMRFLGTKYANNAFAP